MFCGNRSECVFIELNVVAQGLGIRAKITDGRADGFLHSAKKWDGVCRSRGMNVSDVFGELQAGGVKRAKGVCWDGLPRAAEAWT